MLTPDDFGETELAQVGAFQKTTLDEQVDWLGHMLEVFQAAEEFRRQNTGSQAETP